MAGFSSAHAVKPLKDIPLDACVCLGNFDQRAAAYVIATRNRLMGARTPSFLSIKEVKSLDEADGCDVTVRISQPGTWFVKTEVFSSQTKELLTTVEASGFPGSNRTVNKIFYELGEGTALQSRLISERQTRLAALDSKKEALAEPKARPSKQSPVISKESSARSDIEALPPPIGKHNKNAYAIIIGIETYRQNLPRADFAESDARLVAAYLAGTLGYPEENVVTLTNDRAALGDFVKYFEKWLPNNVEKDGIVFIYYSGHGAPDPKTGGAYLVPYDGDPVFIAETGYSLKRMYDALGRLPAKEIVVALDSCFSGAGGRSVIAKGARPLVMNISGNLALSKNMTVISASSGDQISSTYDEKGHGLFTYFLLKGIKNEDVVKPDGTLKVEDLYGYLKPQVERIARKQYNNEQTPQLMGAKNH
ncbi:MAG: hypothetical protein EG826_16880 [Deltaproteobacteria bacterium]|nr:hypothetical protein [Deltaproteobacteria bacterium]